MTFVDRYRCVGLTHNPFAAPQHRDKAVNGFVDRGIADLPPPGSNTLVQVIGDSGLGKSTQLNQWRKATPGPRHYIVRAPYWQRWARPHPVEAATNIAYGDEIDRMPVIVRRQWFRQLAKDRATVAIGTHVDLSALGKRFGFRVISHWLRPVTADVLATIVHERLRHASCGPVHVHFSDRELEWVIDHSHGNPREADVICHQILADRVALHSWHRHKTLLHGRSKEVLAPNVTPL